ncbi:MAG: hypothetical protein N3A38_06430 [Planctomycetota bacterium]|nr:hypothetical protein [Planctomycetota bacterium]
MTASVRASYRSGAGDASRRLLAGERHGKPDSRVSVRTCRGAAAILAAAAILPAVAATDFAQAAEIIVTQKYSFAQADDPEGTRDVVQKLYLGKEKILIEDEVETVLVDIKGETITTYYHKRKTYLRETFAERRKRIEDSKADLRADMDQVVGAEQRRKLRKLYRYLLDDDRRYRIEWPGGGKGETANVAGVECRRVRVLDEDGNVVYEGYVHPELEMPYDSAEVLYLLQIIGRKLADTIRSDPGMKKLPMSLTLMSARGGTVRAEAVKVETVEKIDPARFAVPEDYKPARPGPGTRIKDPDAE